MSLARNRNSPKIGFKEFSRVIKILKSGSFAQGKEVAFFEIELSTNLSRFEHAAVNS